MQPKFGEPTADFLDRDAKVIGWDGSSTTSVAHAEGIMVYRNGDFRVHEAMWKKLDEVFKQMGAYADFAFQRGNQGIQLKTEFKLKLISQFYQNWAKTKLVGGPPTVIVRSHGLPLD